MPRLHKYRDRNACYVLTAKRVLGIDLGTTNSTVAQVQLPLHPAGSAELLCECISVEQMTPCGAWQKNTEASRLFKVRRLA
jgi:hypothetical protein